MQREQTAGAKALGQECACLIQVRIPKKKARRGKRGVQTALRALRAVEGNVLEIPSKVKGEARGSAEQG